MITEKRDGGGENGGSLGFELRVAPIKIHENIGGHVHRHVMIFPSITQPFEESLSCLPSLVDGRRRGSFGANVDQALADQFSNLGNDMICEPLFLESFDPIIK